MNKTLTAAPPAASETPRGFAVKCILCGQPAVRVSLADVRVFYCDECGDGFALADVEKHLDGWRAVLAWVRTAPALTGRAE